MAGPIASLFVKLGLDAREFTQGIDKAQTTVQGFTRDSGSRFSQFGANVKQGFGLAFGFATQRIIGEGISFITGGINDSVEAFKQQEEATSSLTASLKANVPGWEGYTGAIKDAEQAAIALGFQDDDLDLSLAKVVAATHDVRKGLDVMRVAEDLARFKHISLQDAADALVKVEAGQYRVLKSLGIQLPKNATAEEALAAVEKVASGQAAAYTETYAGRQDVLNAKLNEQQEIIGERLVPIQLKFNEILVTAATAVGDFVDNYDRLKQSLVETPKTNFLDTMPSQQDTQAALQRLDAMANDASRTAEFFNSPFDKALFDANVGGVKDAWQKQVDDLNHYLATTAFDQTGKAVQTGLGDGAAALDAYMAQLESRIPPIKDRLYTGMAGAFSAVPQAWMDVAAKNADLLLQPFRDIGAGIPSDILKGMQTTESTLTTGLADLKDLIKNGLTPDDLATKAAGAKTIKLFQQGMNSEVIGAKEQAEMVAGAAIKAFSDAADNGVLGGKDAAAAGAYLGGLFNSGLNSEQVDAILEGAHMSQAAIDGIHSQFPRFFQTGATAADKTTSGFDTGDFKQTGSGAAGDIRSGFANHPWFRWGQNVSQTWIDGFTQTLRSGKGDIRDALRNATGGMIAFSPPKEGPLTNIDKWGYNLGKTWIDAMAVGIRGGVAGVNQSMTGLGVASLAGAPGLAVGAGHAPVVVNIGRVYGGPAGLRELNAEIQAAVRQSTRGANREVGR